MISSRSREFTLLFTAFFLRHDEKISMIKHCSRFFVAFGPAAMNHHQSRLGSSEVLRWRGKLPTFYHNNPVGEVFFLFKQINQLSGSVFCAILNYLGIVEYLFSFASSTFTRQTRARGSRKWEGSRKGKLRTSELESAGFEECFMICFVRCASIALITDGPSKANRDD